MLKQLRVAWRILRQLSGDDAYERYLEHFVERSLISNCSECQQPLSKKAFFRRWQDEKWYGVKRCC
jgi:uncharacterized short protein YbdD (DUF466 family)